MKNRQWQVQGQGSAAESGPFQDHPILPEERTLKARKYIQSNWNQFMTNQIEFIV